MKIPALIFRNCCTVNSVRISRRFLHQEVWNSQSTPVNEKSLKSQLTKLSVPFEDGYTCLRVKKCACCPDSTIKGSIFINKRTGFFLCEHCRVTGNWSSYRDLLEKSQKKEETNLTHYKEDWNKYDKVFPDWEEVESNTEPLIDLVSTSYKKVFKDFKLPFCSKTVMNKLDVRISNEQDILYFPLRCFDSLVVGYKTYNMEGKESTSPRMDCPGFLLHASQPKTSALIVSNIQDFLAVLSQNLHNYEVICLQYGANYLPQMTLPFLEKYKKIVLWLEQGNLDVIGCYAQKLIEKRCYVVKSTEDQISPTVALESSESIAEIVSKAKLTYHQFVITFSSLRDVLLSELQNESLAVGVPWKRFPGLTNLLKGHRRGELSILTGPTGVGKTTFLSEYSLDLAMQGVNTLWGSFEIKNIKLAKILLTQFVGGPLPQELTAYNELCDKFEQFPLFFLSFHGQEKLENVMDAVQHCSYVHDIAHIIIDNVQFMIEVSPDISQLDRFWQQDRLIQTFRNFASRFNCHVMLVMHPKKIEGWDLNMNSIFGGGKASQEADNVLIIQKRQFSNGYKKYLQVVKNRFSGDLGSFPLCFDKPSLSFSKRSSSVVRPEGEGFYECNAEQDVVDVEMEKEREEEENVINENDKCDEKQWSYWQK